MNPKKNQELQTHYKPITNPLRTHYEPITNPLQTHYKPISANYKSISNPNRTSGKWPLPEEVIMENEPNFKNRGNVISDYKAGNYNRCISKSPQKNEPKRTQFA